MPIESCPDHITSREHVEADIIEASDLRAIGWYYWRPKGSSDFCEIVQVVEDEDWRTGASILVMMRVGYLGCCNPCGQFKGPLIF